MKLDTKKNQEISPICDCIQSKYRITSWLQNDYRYQKKIPKKGKGVLIVFSNKTTC